MTLAPTLPVHRTVLLQEAVDALNVRANGVYVDGTFGRGGHSRLILQRLGESGRLYVFDKDPQAIAVAEAWKDARVTVCHQGFASMATVLAEHGVSQVDGILLDLGISSPQIDQAERGFSFRLDGPLDMRMDTSRGLTVAQWLAEASVDEIREVVREYGEERFATQIARQIVKARLECPIERTKQLAELVAQVIRTREPGQDPATRTFQALRIFINRELEELEQLLPQTLNLLQARGRLVVISFHSLEDRLVKRFIQTNSRVNLPIGLPVRAADMPQPPLQEVGRWTRPSAAEVAENPRARSAIMRVAERVQA